MGKGHALTAHGEAEHDGNPDDVTLHVIANP